MSILMGIVIIGLIYTIGEMTYNLIKGSIAQ